MSDLPTDYSERLNLREQIARIDRNQAEVSKLLAEYSKLNAEAVKFQAEQVKLNAEAAKFQRDRFLAPILAAAALGGLIAALGGLAGAFLRGSGLR